jgi:hypothetical protein
MNMPSRIAAYRNPFLVIKKSLIFSLGLDSLQNRSDFAEGIVGRFFFF